MAQLNRIIGFASSRGHDTAVRKRTRRVTNDLSSFLFLSFSATFLRFGHRNVLSHFSFLLYLSPSGRKRVTV